MNIRIDIKSEGPETFACIAGRLCGASVAELTKACEQIENPFVIDLSDLLFADDAGINAIQTLAERGVQVRGASPFVQLLLDNASGLKTGGGESNHLKWV